MQLDHLILSEARLPQADDSEVLHLLELAAETTGVGWMSIELYHPDAQASSQLQLGSPDGAGTTSTIALDQGFSATVTCPAPLSDSMYRLISYTLNKILEVRLLRQQAELLRAALDTTTSAVLLFDSGGDIVYANPPADRLLSRQTEDSLAVEKPGERPQPLFTLLCGLVDEIAKRPETKPFWHGTLALSDGEMLACEIVRMQGYSSGQKTSVLAVMQTVNALPDRHLSAFSTSHCLTRREEEVLGQLSKGLRTSEIAGRLGISPHTVRDHLKHLYRKTGTGSRSELLNQLASTTSAPPPDAQDRTQPRRTKP
jgi:DNA-binding CsgD family transcriptional regulator/PAS domain-containing protein